MSSAPLPGRSPSPLDMGSFSILITAPNNTPAREEQRHQQLMPVLGDTPQMAARSIRPSPPIPINHAFARQRVEAAAAGAQYRLPEDYDSSPDESEQVDGRVIIMNLSQRVVKQEQEITALREMVKFYFSVHADQLRKDFPQIYRRHMQLLGIDEKKDAKGK